MFWGKPALVFKAVPQRRGQHSLAGWCGHRPEKWHHPPWGHAGCNKCPEPWVLAQTSCWSDWDDDYCWKTISSGFLLLFFLFFFFKLFLFPRTSGTDPVDFGKTSHLTHQVNGAQQPNLTTTAKKRKKCCQQKAADSIGPVCVQLTGQQLVLVLVLVRVHHRNHNLADLLLLCLCVDLHAQQIQTNRGFATSQHKPGSKKGEEGRNIVLENAWGN